jgi:hypothetical protein
VELCILLFIYTLLLPEDQMGEAWEPSKKQCFFQKSGSTGYKVTCILQRVKIMPVYANRLHEWLDTSVCYRFMSDVCEWFLYEIWHFNLLIS